MKLVVGLGNIGPRYAHTRHNIGFMVADRLAEINQAGWKIDDKLKAAVCSIKPGDEDIILAKPQTMMNLSGDAVMRLMQKFRLKPADVWVIYDDVDVDFGRLRLRLGASSGQQGVRSITAAIGSQFVHVRMGISLNDRAVEPSEVYVLKPFNADEAAKLPAVIAGAADILTQQLTAAEPAESTFVLV